MLTSQAYKLLGVALVLLGGFLAATGALLMILAAPEVVGGMGIKLFVWGIFGLLSAIGLTAMTAGWWQVFSGRRNQSLMTVVIVLVVTIFLIAGIGMAVL